MSKTSADSIKQLAKRILPPFLADWLQRVRQRLFYGGPEWEYLPNGWSTINDRVQGWNVKSIPDTQKAKWPEFISAIEGTGPLGVAYEAPTFGNDDYYMHHIVMAFGYVLALAAQKKEQLSVLDWGGGIGHYFALSRCLLPDSDIDYFCKELTLLCEAGREVVPEIQFIDSDEEAASRRYDLVVASGALQCSEDWKSVTRLLASCANAYLYITRLPIVSRSNSFVALQRVYAYGYDTEYMCWFLNRDELVNDLAAAGLCLVREFIFHKHPIVKGAPEQAQIQGFLFKAQA